MSASEAPTAAATQLVQIDGAAVEDGTLRVSGWIRDFGREAAAVGVRFGDQTFDLDASQITATEDAALSLFHLAVAVPRSTSRSYLQVVVLDPQGRRSGSVWPVALSPSMMPRLANPSTRIVGAHSEIESLSTFRPNSFELQGSWLIAGRVLLLRGWFLPGSELRLQAEATGQDIGAVYQRTVGGLGQTYAQPTVGLLNGRRVEWRVLPLSTELSTGALALREVGTSEALRCTPESDAERTYEQLGVVSTMMSANQAIDLIEACVAALSQSAPADAGSDALESWLYDQIVRLPTSLDLTSPRALIHCDSAAQAAERGLIVRGWFYFAADDIDSVAYRDEHGGFRIDDSWTTVPRGDVTTHLTGLGLACHGDRHGFSCFVPLAAVSRCGHLRVTLISGTTARVQLPPMNLLEGMAAIREILSAFSHTDWRARDKLEQWIGPAIQGIWSGRRTRRRPPEQQQFGPVPLAPTMSVIVPLYARHDLAEYQLAQFANDPDVARQQLIYFVDDPSIFEDFRLRCRDLYEIYRVPFTLAYAGANLGFAGANNCAAQLATAPYLVLLNSDVFPSRPGWLSRMLDCYRTQRVCGVLGVKLLYEDDGVQHVGMAFKRHAPWGDLWTNAHPCRGQASDAFKGVQDVPAVTAACALIEAALFHAVGGLSEEYVLGDFEDSDLCLKVLQVGRRNYVLLDEALYHLERQSLSRAGDAHWRANLAFFNCWQQHRKWSAQIEALLPT